MRTWRHIGWWLALAILCSPWVHAEHVALFSNSDNLEQAVQDSIDKCQLSIDVAVYGLTSTWLMSALQKAAHRGVEVRILVDENGLDSKLRQLWQDTGHLSLALLQGQYPGRGLMHHKFAIFDNGSVVTGSYNWTAGAGRLNYDNALWEDEPDVVRAYNQEFEKLWSRAHMATSTNDAPQRLQLRIGPFGPSSSIPVRSSGVSAVPSAKHTAHHTARHPSRSARRQATVTVWNNLLDKPLVVPRPTAKPKSKKKTLATAIRF